MSLSSILFMARRGWLVVPVHPPRRGKDTTGKIPITENGYYGASDDEDLIADWYSRFPKCSWGIRTGPQSELLVLDLDVKPDGSGVEYFAQKAEELGHAWPPDTLSVTTGGGGKHYYFAYGGDDIASGAGLWEPKSRVDWRSSPGFVVAPPSGHHSGGAYVWDNLPDWLNRPLPEPPEWLLVELRHASSVKRAKVRNDRSSPAFLSAVEGTRNNSLASTVGHLARLGCTYGEAEEITRAMNARLESPLDESELERTVADNYGRWGQQAIAAEWSETGMTRRLHTYLKGRFLYRDTDGGTWYVWDHTRWREDTGMTAVMGAVNDWQSAFRFRLKSFRDDELPEELADEFFGVTEESAKRWLAWLDKGGNLQALLARVPALDSGHGFVVDDPQSWDYSPGKIPFKDCTALVSLKTGRVSTVPHNPSHLFTQTAGTALADEPSALWEETMLSWMGGSRELADYVQRVVGYTAAGWCTEEVFFLVYGRGANGKSVFLNLISAALGSLCSSFPVSRLEKSPNEPHPEWLAGWRGKRMVRGDELGRNARLDDARIKRLTGGDIISARAMFKNSSDFRPTHTLWITSNDIPVLSGDDLGIRRRLQLVPFRQSFLGREDKTLSERLQKELPGIARWVVEGARQYALQGLNPPAEVLVATQEAIDENDPVGAWLQDRLVADPQAFETSEALYQDYVDYYGGVPPRYKTSSTLAKALKALGTAVGCKTSDSKRRGIKGYRLIQRPVSEGWRTN